MNRKTKTIQCYFDRYGERGSARGVSIFLSAVFLLFVGYILVRYQYFTYIVRDEVFSTPMFGRLVLGYAGVFALFAALIYVAGRRGKSHPVVWGIGIFCVALALRLAVYQVIVYTPESDFQNYYRMGVAFAQGDYACIAETSAGYHIPEFSGLGVINGLLMTAFGTNLRSFQLVQCVVTALTCVVIYGIARHIDRRAAPAAGLLFAFYPANIFYSQVTSNQHLGVLFSLLAVLLLLSAKEPEQTWKALCFGFAAAVALLISQFSHPSTATTLLAFALYLLTSAIAARKQRKKCARTLLVAVVLMAAFFGLHAAANAAMTRAGLLDEEALANSSYLAKIVIGLNPDTEGAYSESDWGAIYAQPADERNSFCLALIRERLEQNDLPDLMDLKILRMWMVKDASFDWATRGTDNMDTVSDSFAVQFDAFTRAYILLDFFYVAAVYLFAWIGILLRRRENGALDLLLWVVLGWMGVHLLIEIQTRYRYLAMALLMVMATVGLARVFAAPGKLAGMRKNKATGPID